MSDLDELTRGLDLDAALSRTYERHGALRHRAVVRRRWVTGGGLALAAVLVAILVPTLSGSDRPTSVGIPAPASGGQPRATASTTRVPDTDVDPDADAPDPVGYVRSAEGDVAVLTTTTPTEVSPQPSAGVGVGASSTTLERGVVTAAVPAPWHRAVTVSFACVHGVQHIDTIRYRVEPTRIVVDAEIGFPPSSAPCRPGDPGLSITLPLPTAFVAGTPVVAEPLHTP